MESKEELSIPQLQMDSLPGSPSPSSPSPSFNSSENLDKNSSLNANYDENTRIVSQGSVSGDEGYESGVEEFLMAVDNPVSVETVGEGVVDENFDAPFVDAPEIDDPLPISSGVMNDETGDVSGKDSVAGVVEEVEMKGVEFKDKGTIDLAIEDDIVKSGELQLVGGSDVKVTPEGDSIVDAIHIASVNPGVVVVGEIEQNGEMEHKEEVEDVVVVATKDDVAEVETKEVEEKVEVTFIEGEGSELVDCGDVKLTPEGDSIVDTIQVDAVSPGVVVVGETEQNRDLAKKEVGDASEAESNEEVAVIAPVDPELVASGDVKLTPEGDSVVDTINIADIGPGIVVVGETAQKVDVENKEEEEDVAEITRVGSENSEVVNTGNMSLTAEGDSIVDSIQVDSVGPGVVVVGEMDDNGGDKIEGVEVPLVSLRGVDESSEAAEDVGESSEAVEDENLDEPDLVDLVDDSVDNVKKIVAEKEQPVVHEALENGITSEITSHEEVFDQVVGSDRNVNHLHHSNGVHSDVLESDIENDEESDEVTDGMIFGGSEAAKKFIEELEQEHAEESNRGTGISLDHTQGIIDGQIVTDSEEEDGDSDDDEDGKELFDTAALAALLKAATGANSDGSGITITSQEGSRLFSVERPAGLGSSLRALRPVPRSNNSIPFNPLAASGTGESDENLSEDDKKKLEKLQQIRVKFLRLLQRLGLSADEPVATQVLYRLALLGGRQSTHTFNLESARQTAAQLEAKGNNDLDFSMNLIVLGKSGVGKSATINSIFGEEKASIAAFERGTSSAKEITGLVDGVKVRVIDTPGLKPSAMEQGFNRKVLSSVQKLTKKSPADVLLYVDRLDAQTRDLNDLPFLKTITASLGPSIWKNAVVTLTHGASAPPEGPSGNPLSYDVFISQRSHVVQQSIGHAVGDLRMMSPSLMSPVTLVENHKDCRTNRDGCKILPNGQRWKSHLLLLCYSMKILSEASALSKPQEPFDNRRLFGLRARSPPLPYMLQSILQSRTHPKLPSDQGNENVDSDVDLDDFSDSDEDGEDEYDQLPPFKPLRKAQIAQLTKEQKNAYFEEYDYRVKLLQKKSWREELKRMREIKKRGGKSSTEYGYGEDDQDSGSPSSVAMTLPDMPIPPTFDSANPSYRYRFLEPTTQFLVRPVLDSHGWDNDVGYDGINLEHSLAIANRFPAAYIVQLTKDKKDFAFSLDSSVAAKYGDKISTLAGFDIQNMGKQLVYIVRGETKFTNFKNHKAVSGVSFTRQGENIIPGFKIEDQFTIGRQYIIVGSAGVVKHQQETAYGGNIELQRRELDYPIGQVQSTLNMSLVKWRGDLALSLNALAQFSLGRNSKVAVRAGVNNKMTGQFTIKTSSSEHLWLSVAGLVPYAVSFYKKIWPGPDENYAMY